MSDNYKTFPRLFIESVLQSGTSATLNQDQSHYLQHVMRAKAGDQVRLFNGRDGEWLGEIAALSKRGVEIKVKNQLRAQTTEADLILCCAPIKKAHFDYMIEKATELGVNNIQPLLTARTQVREVNVERCHAMATEAAEQSERLSVPTIQKPIELKKLLSDWPQDRTLIVCAEAGDAIPVQEAFTAPHLKSAKKISIITGPEGGFAEDEFTLMRKIPHAVFIRLGPRILRADTAAIAALSCWQAIRGDWRPEAGG